MSSADDATGVARLKVAIASPSESATATAPTMRRRRGPWSGASLASMLP